MNDRKCLQCFEQLTGRADRKFCCDQCRSLYNYHQAADSDMLIKSINRILQKNYSILTMLKAKGKTTTNRSDLLKIGYCFEYFTYTNITRRRKHTNFYCYDQGFREEEHDKLILVHRNLDDDLSTPRW